MAINFEKVPSHIRKEIDPPKKTLQRGSRGRKVRQVQEWLQYHNCHTNIDGQYGPATHECVKDFQLKMQLKGTGTVGKKTWRALVAPMTTALCAPTIDSSDTAPMTVEHVAMQHVEQNSHEIGGSNRGPWVRLYCEGQHGEEWRWCAGFVSFVMQQAYFYRQETPPFKGSVSCDTLSSQAKRQGLFVSNAKLRQQKISWLAFGGACLFLRRRSNGHWSHTGLAFSATGKGKNLVFHSIEGNTNDEGSHEGYEACKRKRSLSNKYYDFVSFVAMN